MLQIHYRATAPGPELRSAAERLKLWRRNWRTRRVLGQLGPDHLRDVGLSEGTAQHEASRPFWCGS